MNMRNTTTNEISPAHLIGTSEDGRKIYQAVEGWELVTSESVECDADGNYLVG